MELPQQATGSGRDIDKDAKYKFEYDGKEVVYSGAYLMNVGLDFEIWWALQSRILVLEKI